MSNYGMTPDLFVQQIGMRVEDFARGATSGAVILQDAITEAYTFIRSQLPKRDAAMLSRVKYEWVEKDAYSGQTTVTLGAPAYPTATLALWKFGKGAGIYDYPARGDSTQLTVTTDYSLGSDGKTVTLVTALADGESIIASYATNLSDDCPTLRMLMHNILNWRMASEYMPDSAPRYKQQYDEAIDYLTRMADGKAFLHETESIETMDELDPQISGGGIAVSKREPA